MKKILLNGVKLLWGKMIKAVIELELVYPYSRSMTILIEFCNLWDCHLMSGGTKKLKATISMPSQKFKKIFKRNPKVREYEIPSGMEKFVSKFTVKQIATKENK
jgi:hypothetical protein